MQTNFIKEFPAKAAKQVAAKAEGLWHVN